MDLDVTREGDLGERARPPPSGCFVIRPGNSSETYAVPVGSIATPTGLHQAAGHLGDRAGRRAHLVDGAERHCSPRPPPRVVT